MMMWMWTKVWARALSPDAALPDAQVQATAQRLLGGTPSGSVERFEEAPGRSSGSGARLSGAGIGCRRGVLTKIPRGQASAHRGCGQAMGETRTRATITKYKAYGGQTPEWDLETGGVEDIPTNWNQNILPKNEGPSSVRNHHRVEEGHTSSRVTERKEPRGSFECMLLTELSRGGAAVARHTMDDNEEPESISWWSCTRSPLVRIFPRSLDPSRQDPEIRGRSCAPRTSEVMDPKHSHCAKVMEEPQGSPPNRANLEVGRRSPDDPKVVETVRSGVGSNDYYPPLTIE